MTYVSNGAADSMAHLTLKVCCIVQLLSIAMHATVADLDGQSGKQGREYRTRLQAQIL